MFKVTPRVYNRRERLFLVQTGLKGQGGEKERKELASHPPNQAKRSEGRLLPGYVNTGTQKII